MSGLGILANVVTGGLGPLLDPVVQLIVDQFPDPVKKAQALQQLQAAQATADAAIQAQQDTINQAEAANENVFVSGWRPFVGWVCGAGLAWQIFVGPMLGWLAHLCGSHVATPTFDTATTSAILVPMLGLGAYRTVEKLQGVAGTMAPFVRANNVAKVTAKTSTTTTVGLVR